MANTAKAPRTYTVECALGCGHTWETTLRPSARKGGLCCGRGDCATEYNRQVAEAHAASRARAARTRRERAAQPARELAVGDAAGWTTLGALMGAQIRKGR